MQGSNRDLGAELDLAIVDGRMVFGSARLGMITNRVSAEARVLNSEAGELQK